MLGMIPTQGHKNKNEPGGPEPWPTPLSLSTIAQRRIFKIYKSWGSDCSHPSGSEVHSNSRLSSQEHEICVSSFLYNDVIKRHHTVHQRAIGSETTAGDNSIAHWVTGPGQKMVRNLKRSPNLCDRQVLRSAVAGVLRCLLKNQICPSLPSPVIPKVLPHTLHRARSSSHRQPDAPTFPMLSCILNSSTAKVRQPQKRLCPVCNTHIHPSGTSHASSLSSTHPHTHI